MNKGWISLYRILFDKTIWKNSTPEQKVILITLLLMVNHSNSQWEWQGQKFNILPGQTITSLEAIAQKAGKGVTVQNVRTALKRFEKLGFLTNESTKTGRLITILNYDIYQSNNDSANNHSNNQPTNDQQTHNNSITTNNNNNNKNNVEEPNNYGNHSSFDLNLKVLKLFCKIHKASYNQEYIITNQNKEIAAAQKLIDLQNTKHEYSSEIELFNSIEVFLKECFNTKDNWIKENISLSTILNKINYFNKTFQNGNKAPYSESHIQEYARVVYECFESTDSNQD